MVCLQIAIWGTPSCQHHAATRVQDLIFTTRCFQPPYLAYINICVRWLSFAQYRIWQSYMTSHIWLIIYGRSYMVRVQVSKIDTPGCQTHAAAILLVWSLQTGACNPAFQYMCPMIVFCTVPYMTVIYDRSYMVDHIWSTIYGKGTSL